MEVLMGQLVLNPVHIYIYIYIYNYLYIYIYKLTVFFIANFGYLRVDLF